MANCPACGKLNDSRLDNCVYCGAHMKASPGGGKGAARRSMKPCPNCGAMVSDTDIICRSCNTNLLTRQRVGAAPAVAKASGGGDTLKWVGGVAAVLLVVAGLAAL